MKHLISCIAIFLLFLSTYHIKAQYLNHFAPVGAEWYIEKSEFFSIGSNYIKYECIDITTIDGIICNVIEKTMKYACADPNPVNLKTIHYLHIDSLQIYEYENGEKYLLYDFSKKEGEHFVRTKYNDTIFIERVERIALLNGDSCTNYIISGSPLYLGCEEMNDRYGSCGELFFSPLALGCSTNSLRCYLENGTLIAKRTNQECDYESVNISEVDNEQQITAYTPFYEDIIIKLPGHLAGKKISIDVYNAQGGLVCHQSKIAENNIHIPFSSQPAGLYIIRILSFNKKYYSLKIIKQ